MVVEGGGAFLLAEMAVASGNLVEEFNRGDGLARLDDVGGDFAEGVIVNYRGGAILVVARCLMRDVVGADGESELTLVRVIAQVVAANVSHRGNVALCGEREDVVGTGEELLAKVACAACFLANVVVADEKKCSVGVVDGIADGAGKLGGNVDATVGHEVVDVVDDDEVRSVLIDEVFDGSVDEPEVLALAAKDVEAYEV